MAAPALQTAVPAGKPVQGVASSDRLAETVTTCWKDIGVFGNGTCPRLTQFVHCRNCPVYSRAGVQLLDRPLLPDYQRDCTNHLAVEKGRSKPEHASAVFFRIQTEWLAIPTQAFQEVSECRPIHSLPHQRGGVVLGLVNVRGELLIAVSLGHLLNIEGIAPGAVLRCDYHRLLVTNWEGQRLAMPVDEVEGPNRFHPQDLKTPPATVTRSAATFTHAVLHWRSHTVGCLRPDALFSALNRSLA